MFCQRVIVSAFLTALISSHAFADKKSEEKKSIEACFQLSQTDRDKFAKDSEESKLHFKCTDAVNKFVYETCETLDLSKKEDKHECQDIDEKNPYAAALKICNGFNADLRKKRDCYYDAEIEFDFYGQLNKGVDSCRTSKGPIESEVNCLKTAYEVAGKAYRIKMEKPIEIGELISAAKNYFYESKSTDAKSKDKTGLSGQR
jgi:hypothetical protein